MQILYSWLVMAKEALDRIAGHTADPEFLKELHELIEKQPVFADVESPPVDRIAAYYSGEKLRGSSDECCVTPLALTLGCRIVVEVDLVLPGDMTVAESHDIALLVQHRIEVGAVGQMATV